MRTLICIIFLIVSLVATSQNLSDRILLDRIPLDVVNEKNITSIDYGRFVEKFDSKGNLIHENMILGAVAPGFIINMQTTQSCRHPSLCITETLLKSENINISKRTNWNLLK
ncbi:MAG: hypothetical protein ABJG68_16785 [Crocinitomicaceae bacterium]